MNVECLYFGRCLCPHYDHESWECFTIEDAEDEEFERQCNAEKDDWDDEGTHICGDRSEP